MKKRGFMIEFVGLVGAPIFGGALVGCFLSGSFELMHGVLMAVGLGMMLFCHWRSQG